MRAAFADQLVGKLALEDAVDDVLLLSRLERVVNLVHEIVEELVRVHLHTRVDGLTVNSEGLTETLGHIGEGITLL